MLKMFKLNYGKFLLMYNKVLLLWRVFYDMKIRLWKYFLAILALILLNQLTKVLADSVTQDNAILYGRIEQVGDNNNYKLPVQNLENAELDKFSAQAMVEKLKANNLSGTIVDTYSPTMLGTWGGSITFDNVFVSDKFPDLTQTVMPEPVSIGCKGNINFHFAQNENLVVLDPALAKIMVAYKDLKGVVKLTQPVIDKLGKLIIVCKMENEKIASNNYGNIGLKVIEYEITKDNENNTFLPTTLDLGTFNDRKSQDADLNKISSQVVVNYIRKLDENTYEQDIVSKINKEKTKLAQLVKLESGKLSGYLEIVVRFTLAQDKHSSKYNIIRAFYDESGNLIGRMTYSGTVVLNNIVDTSLYKMSIQYIKK